jgi:hypothetical protein
VPRREVPRSESAAASVQPLNAPAPERARATLVRRFIATPEPVLTEIPKKGRPPTPADTPARPRGSGTARRGRTAG